ncbi:hypothetical protein LA345_41495 (plasmid) [Burkholderia vietnamiensis]|nr:hypothetical protein [Burkholderia vietnamiensis]
MNLRFHLSRTVSMQNVRFPFPIRWRCHSGVHDITAEIVLKRSVNDACWYIPAETLFSFTVEPGIEGSARGALTVESFDSRSNLIPDWLELHSAFRQRKTPFGRALAQQMFTHPAYPWTISEVSGHVDVDGRRLRVRLFQEAYSFASTLRRCRMLRALLSALSRDAVESGANVQFLPQCRYRVDSMFDAAFQTKLSTIEMSRLLDDTPSIASRRNSTKGDGSNFFWPR